MSQRARKPEVIAVYTLPMCSPSGFAECWVLVHFESDDSPSLRIVHGRQLVVSSILSRG